MVIWLSLAVVRCDVSESRTKDLSENGDGGGNEAH